jgi:two-component system, OmpR family, phosphate regulon sensor histidine kinase PhoR
VARRPATAFRRRLDEHGLARLLARLNEGILAVDESLEVVFANPAAEQLLGTRAGTQLADPWPEPSLRELAAALHDPGAEELDLPVRIDDQRAFRLQGLPGGSESAAILVLIDISERERRERGEREFVANAAHELRTPLTAITSAIEVLQAGAKHFESERDLFLGHIEREAARLRRLAHSLLLLARAQALHEQPRVELVELAPLLEEAVAVVAARPSIRIQVECPPDLGALANREMVEQILSVLASNAVRYTAQGEIGLRGRRDGREAVIEVADTGTGVPDEVIERVGDRFVRGSEDGFGLGLSIAQQLAEALHGRLELARRPEGGTLATLRLPAARMTRA